jgi:hypothetical protein
MPLSNLWYNPPMKLLVAQDGTENETDHSGPIDSLSAERKLRPWRRARRVIHEEQTA